MDNINLKKDLTVEQVVNFVISVRNGIPESLTLSELVTRCFNDRRMFDSWFNHFDVMN